MNPKRVPDLFYDYFSRAKERGQDDDSAAWYAEMKLQQMAEEPELPKENEDGE